MDDSLKASTEGLKIVKDAGWKKGWTKTVTPEWWNRANTTQATLKRFWRRIPIDGSAFRGICAAVGVDWRDVVEPCQIKELPPVATPRENPAITTVATPAVVNSNFVGREGAFADLNTKMNQGAKVIVIQAPGGVGKTTLAQEFLSSLGFEVGLELLMAKEEANITPVESVVEEWLKRDFGEEPGRDFGVMLGRLKRQLQSRRVGVLIDNLEPALDGQGRFLEPHRCYVELLRVLADSSVKSLTLITSREPLAEGLSISSYSLPSLGEEAWADFFSSREIEVEATILREIHRAYGGNALAMTILCDPIQRDGGMGAYWREHKIEAGLLVELAVENLVKEQFNRLEKISPEAYLLLCRLGCYRYQDVPTVPTEGLFCLMWDVLETQRKRVIEFLRNWSLVQFDKGQYWLHPVIRSESISRLKESSIGWKLSNNKAAEFWKSCFDEILTIKDASFAFEAYHHYVSVEDFNSSIQVISLNHTNASSLRESVEKSLGLAASRLGLNHEIIYVVTHILQKTNDSYYLSELYYVLGRAYSLLGQWKKSIDCNEKSAKLATKYLTEKHCQYKDHLFYRLKRLELGRLINISFCLIDLNETERATQNLEECLLMSESLISESEEIFLNFSIDNYSMLSFLKALNGSKEEAYYLARKAEAKISLVQGSSLTRGYGLFFLGLTYKILGEIDKSFEVYREVIRYTKYKHYTQIQGKALTGISELCRLKDEFETALSHHEESIELLEKIGAKCDLAEAYYQLALTYQAIGEPDQCQEYAAKAIQLFEEMEAPKQVEKVRRAIENDYSDSRTSN